jgi:hypothetical protein
MSNGQRISSLSYERDGSVGIWRIEDFETLFEEELDAAEEWYRDESGNDRITATLVQFDGAPNLSGDVQSHINEVWSHLAQIADIERAGYVGDGIAAMAVKSKVEAPGVDIEDFEDMDAALEWAKA